MWRQAPTIAGADPHAAHGGKPVTPQERIDAQVLRRNVKRFRGGLVFKAHILLYHSTLGLRVIKKKKFMFYRVEGSRFRD